MPGGRTDERTDRHVAVLHLTVLPPTQHVKLFILEISTVAVKKLAINYILVHFYITIIIMIILITFIVTLTDLARLYKVTGSCKTFMIAIPSHSIISVAATSRRAAPLPIRENT